jgi:hypothetical protein
MCLCAITTLKLCNYVFAMLFVFVDPCIVVICRTTGVAYKHIKLQGHDYVTVGI